MNPALAGIINAERERIAREAEVADAMNIVDLALSSLMQKPEWIIREIERLRAEDSSRTPFVAAVRDRVIDEMEMIHDIASMRRALHAGYNFDTWWEQCGRVFTPIPGENPADHTRRVAKDAWRYAQRHGRP